MLSADLICATIVWAAYASCVLPLPSSIIPLTFQPEELYKNLSPAESSQLPSSSPSLPSSSTPPLKNITTSTAGGGGAHTEESGFVPSPSFKKRMILAKCVLAQR